MEIDDLECGKAGEYLVCADLILAGFPAFPSDQGMPFDVVTQVDNRLYRIQVKTTRKSAQLPQRSSDQPPGYLFHARRCGKGGRKRYGQQDTDIVAFVALDTREIGYLAFCDTPTCLILRSSLHRGQYAEETRTARDAAIRKMRDGGASYQEIGTEMGIDWRQVFSICKYRKKVSYGRYLSDMPFSAAVDRATKGSDANPHA